MAAGLAAALFAVHPLRVEPVAWASGQAYLPCALTAMLSVLAYLRAQETVQSTSSRARAHWLMASIGLFAASLLFKAASLALPGVLLVLDWYPLRRFGSSSGKPSGATRRQVLLEKVPFVLLCLAAGVLAMLAKRADRTLVGLGVQGAGVPGRFALACHSVWFYLAKTLWPADLHAFPMRPEPLDWSQPAYLWSMIGVVAVSVWFCHARHSHPGRCAAWLAYLLLLAPMSGLVTYGRQVIGDRYSYLAMMPWAVVAAWVLCRWLAWLQLRFQSGAASTPCGAWLAWALVWRGSPHSCS